MKHSATLLLLLAAIFFHTNVNAYSQGITLKVSDATLDKVFNLIQKQTNFVFVYSAKQIAGAKKVSVDMTNEKFENVMKAVMADQPLKWEVDKEFVIIKVKVPRLLDSGDVRPGELTGRVTNEQGEPVAGATITIKGSKKSAATDADGQFNIEGVENNAIFIVSSVGYESKVLSFSGNRKLAIQLVVKAQSMKEIVVMNTGYQTLTPDRTVGSFSVIDRKLLNRSVSSNILDRIKNLVPGILSTDLGTDPLLIRSKGTILSDASPLIVVDNFPYNGNITNINPNDVENVTILKDASAASIWGARASNGVIVITTKRGKTAKPQVSLNSIVSIQNRPNLFTQSIISSSDFIELEKTLFDRGLYDDEELFNDYNYGHPPFTPVIELLLSKRKGLISEEEVNQRIDDYKKIDARNDIYNHLYRQAISQQYNLNISGNTPFLNYYLSVGWDRGLQNLVGSNQNRVTINSKNNFKINEKIQAAVDLNYTNDNSSSGDNQGFMLKSTKDLYPYAKLIDEKGNSLAIPKNLRQMYIDTVANGRLMDWAYKPLDEIKNSTSFNNSRTYHINIGLKYQITRSFGIDVLYQYLNQVNNSGTYFTKEAYYTRDLVNRFTQILPNGSFSYPVPNTGGIMDRGNSEITSHNGRIGFRYNQSINEHSISALGGWEINDKKLTSNFNRFYGYDETSSLVSSIVDYTSMFVRFDNSYVAERIPTSAGISQQSDRFLSYFLNVGYQYNNKYLLSMSGRSDAANLLGAETNKQRGLPLWSIGAGWQINEEKFFNVPIIKQLKFRASYGYNGNISRRSSALTTIRNGISTGTGLITAMVTNPPNERLRWEKVGVFNIGVDFILKNEILSGTVELYNKNSKDLMGAVRVDPTLGVGQFLVTNSAGMKGKGIEISLNSKNIDRKFIWNTSLNVSYAFSKVTSYNYINSTLGKDYLDGGIIIGKPLNVMYSYLWGGLDPENGDPRGYMGNKISVDYNSIINNTKLDSLKFEGVTIPKVYGNVMNTFNYKQFSLSINISYQLGHVMRRSSVRYSNLVTGSTWTAHGDYGNRWQKKGDENVTNIPSIVYSANGLRDNFYAYSSVHTLKGDNIRLEDIRVSWSLINNNSRAIPVRNVSLFAYSNLGVILWKKNNIGYDPYVRDGIRPGKTFSIGVNLEF